MSTTLCATALYQDVSELLKSELAPEPVDELDGPVGQPTKAGDHVLRSPRPLDRRMEWRIAVEQRLAVECHRIALRWPPRPAGPPTRRSMTSGSFFGAQLGQTATALSASLRRVIHRQSLLGSRVRSSPSSVLGQKWQACVCMAPGYYGSSPWIFFRTARAARRLDVCLFGPSPSPL